MYHFQQHSRDREAKKNIRNNLNKWPEMNKNALKNQIKTD